jgi:hypothetical protein
MENARVISLNGAGRLPGADPEVYERFQKWFQEVYGPVMMRVPERRQVDWYQTIRESPLFPAMLVVLHYENYAGWESARKNPEAISISGEMVNRTKRGIMEMTWSAVYRLVKSYRNENSNPGKQPDTRIENASFLHLEAYRMTEEASEKYNKWFTDYCSNIFIPLFMKQPGLKGFDYYKYVGISVNPSNLEMEHPAYFSAIYFENSNELAVCKKTLRDIFPRGLKYEWYVQYQLNWRR